MSFINFVSVFVEDSFLDEIENVNNIFLYKFLINKYFICNVFFFF